MSINTTVPKHPAARVVLSFEKAKDPKNVGHEISLITSSLLVSTITTFLSSVPQTKSPVFESNAADSINPLVSAIFFRLLSLKLYLKIFVSVTRIKEFFEQNINFPGSEGSIFQTILFLSKSQSSIPRLPAARYFLVGMNQTVGNHQHRSGVLCRGYRQSFPVVWCTW